MVLVPGAMPRYVVALRIDPEEAKAAARRVLARPTIPRVLREHGRIQDLSLCYVPFYEFTAIRLGTFFLREREKAPAPETRDGAQDPEFQRWLLEPPAEKEDTRIVEQDSIRIGPACDLVELGADRIRLEELRRGANPLALEPYDLVTLQSKAVVFAPTKEPGHFAEDAQRRIKVRGDHTAFVEQHLKLLYYPVWQARFRYRGRPYDIAVDGISGTVLRARAPVESAQAALLAVGALAAAAVCFGRPVRALFRSASSFNRAPGWVLGIGGSLLGLVVGGAIASALAWMAWTRFRRPGEMLITEGEGGMTVEAGSPAGNWEGLGAWIIRWLVRS